MREFVSIESSTLVERLVALPTLERLFSVVDSHVPHQDRGASKEFAKSSLTDEGRLSIQYFVLEYPHFRIFAFFSSRKRLISSCHIFRNMNSDYQRM